LKKDRVGRAAVLAPETEEIKLKRAFKYLASLLKGAPNTGVKSNYPFKQTPY
jgi:hypothetical protein